MPRRNEPVKSGVCIDSRPEIVFGLVGALGTDLEKIGHELQQALLAVNYSCSVIRISRLFDEFTPKPRSKTSKKSNSPSESIIANKMEVGDLLRERYGKDFCARLAVAAIHRTRNRSHPQKFAHATIVHSLKRKEEIHFLQETYQTKYITIGIWSPDDERQVLIVNNLRKERFQGSKMKYEQAALELMSRDEKDSINPCGQDVRGAFELADIYVSLKFGHNVSNSVSRIIRLLFGHPFETPTRDEYAMFHASGTSLRSSAAGRQVGAAVVDQDGEILVSGMNEVPKAGGGQYWCGDIPDHRDFSYGYDFNDLQKLLIVDDILSKLSENGWLSNSGHKQNDRETLGIMALGSNGPLEKSTIRNIIEFGRIIHAEMACICTAARRGTPLNGASIFITTYPCHECARLIIAAGIKEIVYIDPYPKSQTSIMYKDEILQYLPTESHVLLRPFEGIAPKLYRHIFHNIDRKRNAITGEFEKWQALKATPRYVEMSESTQSLYVSEAITIRLLSVSKTGIRLRTDIKRQG
ncbi:MAG: deaminase, partial [Actinomycetota bacterium]|nr:deaminase [Actinomycetota bacterium]